MPFLDLPDKSSKKLDKVDPLSAKDEEPLFVTVDEEIY